MRRTLIALALSTALAGCGEDPLAAEDYRAEMRTICQEADRQREAVTQPTRPTPDAIADYLQRLRDINARAIERVEELEPPEELQDPHDRALDGSREGRERVDEVIEKLQGGGDPAQVLSEARVGIEQSRKETMQAARELGVPECGN